MGKSLDMLGVESFSRYFGGVKFIVVIVNEFRHRINVIKMFNCASIGKESRLYNLLSIVSSSLFLLAIVIRH